MIYVTKQKRFKVIVDDDFDTSIFDTHYISTCGSRMKYAILVDKKTGSQVLLHRFLMSPGDDMVIDHINNNGLDNRIENLRVCEMRQNNMNRAAVGRGASRYKGVKMHNDKIRYQAQLGGKDRYYLGIFDSEEEAAIAHDCAAIQVYGEYASCNIIGR